MNSWVLRLLVCTLCLHEKSYAFSLGKEKGIKAHDVGIDMREMNYVPLTRRGNDLAQQLFDTIASYLTLSRNDLMTSPSWKKMKRYIYHATTTSNVLSTDQVMSVLEVLDIFEDELTLSILQSIPRVLRKDPKTHLRPTISFLREIYGDLFLEAMRRNPKLLLASGVGYNSKKQTNTNQKILIDCDSDEDSIDVEAFLISRQLLSKARVEKLKVSHPMIFQLSTSKVKSNVDFLEERLDLTTSQDIIGRIIQGNPNILSLSTLNLDSKLSFLKSCGFHKDAELTQILKKYPGVLGLSLDGNLKPSLAMIRTVLARYAFAPASADDLLRKSLLLHPNLLAISAKNFQEKTAYFDDLNGLSGHNSSLSARILSTVPSVYSLSLKNNIHPKVEYLRKIWGIPNSQTSHSKVVKYLYEYPNILSLSLEGNVQPTVNFYNRTGYIKLDESGQNTCSDTVLSPRFISTSLTRLLTRWSFYKAQFSYQEETREEFTKPPIHILATATDENFCAKMGFDISAYLNYREEFAPRLKFNYQFETWLKTGFPILLDDLQT